MLIQVLRFGVVGVFVTMLHVLVSMGLILIANVPPIGANGIAFVTATMASYVGNTRWSFGKALRQHSLMRFTSVSLIGLAVTLGLATVAEAAGLPYYLGIAIVVLVVPGLSFFLHRFWTYR